MCEFRPLEMADDSNKRPDLMFGVHVGCTLNTKPGPCFLAVEFGVPPFDLWHGTKFAIPSMSSFTPKELIAEPNQMGV